MDQVEMEINEEERHRSEEEMLPVTEPAAPSIFQPSAWEGLARPAPKVPELFCLDCFEDGKRPFHYSLNRNNLSTKKSHQLGQHTGMANKKIRYASPKEIIARDALEKWKTYKTVGDPNPKLQSIKKKKIHHTSTSTGGPTQSTSTGLPSDDSSEASGSGLSSSITCTKSNTILSTDNSSLSSVLGPSTNLTKTRCLGQSPGSTSKDSTTPSAAISIPKKSTLALAFGRSQKGNDVPTTKSSLPSCNTASISTDPLLPSSCETFFQDSLQSTSTDSINDPLQSSSSDLFVDDLQHSTICDSNVDDSLQSSVTCESDQTRQPDAYLAILQTSSSLHQEEVLLLGKDSPTSQTPQSSSNISSHDVAEQLKDLKVMLQEQQRTLQTLVEDKTDRLTAKVADELEQPEINWSSINSLKDLLIKCPIFTQERRRLNKTLYIRCEACHLFAISVDGQHHQGRIKRHDSFAFGLKIKPNDEDDILSGSAKNVNRAWILFKSKMKKHYEGVDSGDLHCQGLVMMEKKIAEKSRAFKIHRVFITAALQVMKSKSAAIHFETVLASYNALGVDTGNKQHSRKQFPCLVEVLAEAIDKRINAYLSNPLPSTTVPPHFFVTFDKSTPERQTNQAIMVVPVVNGKRVSYFLDAPVVYSVDPGQISLSGGQFESLASQIKLTLDRYLPTVQKASCVGAVADGQYQTQKFIKALSNELVRGTTEFDFVVWDPSHYLDLVVKKFSSDPYMDRLAKRAARFHSKLGQGKMFSIAENIGRQSDEKTLRTKSLSTTRFIASTIASFKTIIQCYRQYVTSLYEYGGMKHNTEDSYDADECMVVGEDFVVDLLVVVDAVTPIVSLMVEMQNLQLPCWKIVPFSVATMKTLQEMLINMKEVRNPSVAWPLSNSLWPYLAKHSSSVFDDGTFQGVKLVEGWLIDSSVKTTKHAPIGWKQRQFQDCSSDAIEFLSGLVKEFNRRIEECIPKGMHTLYEGIDLTELLRSVGGQWNVALKEPILKKCGSSSAEKFAVLHRHIRSLPHLKDLHADADMVKPSVPSSR